MVLMILLITSNIYGQRTVVQDPPLTITILAANPPTVCGGADGNISVVATPTPAYYQWSNGSTSANMTNLVANTYSLTVTSSSTICVADTTIQLGSITPPAITLQPLSQILCAGDALTLFVTATDALTYQWYKNGILIPGATSAMYTVPMTSTSDGGSYQCIAYSGACQANSNVANITVKPSPIVNVGNQTVTWPNTSATFTATGGGTYNWSTGASTASITVNTAGTYTVTVTGSNGCTTVDNATLIVNGGPLTLNSVSANPANICSGASTQLNTVVTDGTTPYTYVWSNGSTAANQMVTLTTTTTFTVLVTDASGATQTDSVTVNVDTPPTPNAGMDQTINITDTTTIGTSTAPGCTYAWSNGSTSAEPQVWPAVTTQYTVTVTNAGGCTATDQVTVFVIGGPFVFANPTNPIISSLGTAISLGQTTQLTTLVSGGTPPYSYAWTSNPVGFNSTIYNPYAQPLATTAYTVVATDALGATLTAQITIIVPPNPPSASIGYGTQDQTMCSGDSVSFVINLSGINPWSVTYNDGNSNIVINNITSSPHTVWVSPTSSTTYLLVSVTDSLNQTTACGGGLTITVNASPTVDLGTDWTVCSGTSVSLFDQSGNLYPYYSWSTGASTSDITVNPTTTTTYTLTAMNSSMCSTTDTVVVTVNPLPTINAGLDHAICAGTSDTLTATGAVSYLWMPINQSGSSIIINDTTNTQYTVTGYNGFGCQGTDIVNVFVNPLPIAEAGADQTICIGNSANLTATGGGTYLWSTGATSASTTVNPTVLTVYTVTVTSPQGCTATDVVGVIVSPLPTVDAGLDVAVCTGSSANLNIIVTGATNYSWSPVTGLDNPNIANPTVIPLVSGSVTYTVLVTNAAGCFASDQINVTADPVPVVTASDVFVCENQPIQLNASASVPNSAFTWTPATGLNNAFIPNPTATISSTTSYSIIATAPTGCVGVKTITVTVTPLPMAEFAAYVVPDSSGRVDFTNASSNATSYVWDFGDGNSSVLSDPSHTYAINGNFNVWLTATNTCGSDSINHIISGIYIGIEELPIDNFNNISIYPNPAVDIIHIAGVENIESFRVSNVIGQIVYQQKVSSNETTVSFDVSQYPAGIYTVNFITIKGNIFSAMIVKGQ